MAVQIGKRLCHLSVFPAQIGNNHIQIGHMVIGQTLNLLNLADGSILLRKLGGQLSDSVLCICQGLVHSGQILQALWLNNIILQIGALVIPMNVMLEGGFHLLI